jgi:excisionase family DNA binding protein
VTKLGKEAADAPPIALTAQPDGRLAYRVDELAKALGVHRRTIERAISSGKLKSTKALGARLVWAESVRELFDRVE